MNSDYPVHVLHILGSIQRGGTESVVFNNYRNIDKNKIQFDVAVDDCSPCEIPQDILDSGCVVYRIPSYKKLLSYILSIIKICKRGNYTIVHSHMNTMSVFALFAAWIAKVPVRIAHNHSTAGDGKDFMRDLMKHILRPFSKIFATHFFSCSENAGRWLFGDNAFNRGEVCVLNNAIETEKFKFNPQKRNELRQIYGLKDKFVVGHIGRFSPPKNHRFLLEIFNILCKTKDNSVLVLIGGVGSAGNGIEDALRKRIDELNLHDKVIFWGVEEDISSLYQLMDVFVLPSLYEGLGMVSIEAQCSGLPCILSDQVPKEAKVNENVTFLSLNEPVEKWADTIANIDSKRADYSKRIGYAGYDIKVVAKELERYYMSYFTCLKKNSTQEIKG